MVASARVEIGPYLYSDPNFRGGKVCITGTGMSLHALAVRFRSWDMTLDEIVADTSWVPESHVRGALAYYLANKTAIDRELDDEAAEEERIYQEWTRERAALRSQ